LKAVSLCWAVNFIYSFRTLIKMAWCRHQGHIPATLNAIYTTKRGPAQKNGFHYPIHPSFVGWIFFFQKIVKVSRTKFLQLSMQFTANRNSAKLRIKWRKCHVLYTLSEAWSGVNWADFMAACPGRLWHRFLWQVRKIGPKGALGSHDIRPIHSAPFLGQSI